MTFESEAEGLLARLFIYCIELAARLNNFPGTYETFRYYEAVTCLESGGVSVCVRNYAHSLKEEASFFFRIANAPLTNLAVPEACKIFTSWVRIMIPDRLPGIPRNEFF